MPKTQTNKSTDIQVLESRIDELQKFTEAQGNRIDLSQKAQAWLRLAQAGSGANGYRATTFEGTGRFGPGFPVLPIEPEVEPRLYEYGAGENLVFIPRAGYGLVTFPVLRSLAALSKEIRLNIEKIKTTLRGFEWDIVFEGPEVDVAGVTYQGTPDLQSIHNFWNKPDGTHDFDQWLAIALEEILVTDALTLYPNEQDHTFYLEIVDGTTMRPLIDFHGKTPKHPAPAYLQVLHGMPTSFYSTEGILYLPRNPKVTSPYGESPIEWILQTIVQAIKHDTGRTTYFTEGNVPAAFAGLPPEWTVTQIQEFTEWYNALIQGDISRANTLMFLPHSGSSLPIHEFNQGDFSDPQIDEWLMTVACWAYGNSPSEFGLTRGEGLGGGGYMEAGENAQGRGLKGVAQFLKRVIDRINRDHLDAPWAKFKWKDLDPVEDKSTEADVHLKYMDKVYTVAYVQDQLGIPEKYRVPEQSTPPVDPMTGLPVQPGQPQLPGQPDPDPFGDPQTYMQFKQQKNQQVDAQEQVEKVHADFKLWKKFAKDALRKNWAPKRFTSEVIPGNILEDLNTALRTASTSALEPLFAKALDDSLAILSGNPNNALIRRIEKDAEDTFAQYMTESKMRFAKMAGELK